MRASIAALVFAAGCGDDITVTPDAPSIDAPEPTPAVITINTTTADFGSQVIGSSSDSIAFTIMNTGEAASGEINATLSGASGDYSIQDGCSTLAGGGSCTITATFTPTTAGQRTATLTINASPGGNVTAQLVGVGQSPGFITIDPSSFAFPDTQVGQTSATTQTFTVTNEGDSTTGTLTVTAASADFDVVTDDCQGETLAADASCDIEIAFSPTSSGPKSFTLTVQGNPGGSTSAAVAGNGFTPALIVATPTAGNFPGTVVGQTSSSQTFTFTNSGGQATGALSAAAVTGTDFDLVSETCSGVILQPNGSNSCAAVVAFNPLTAGDKTGTLSVTGTPGGTANVSLTGSAQTAASIQVAPDTRAFGNVNVGQTATQVFTVSNGGAVATGVLATSITGDAQFSIVAGSNGCAGQVLAPLGGSCQLTVQYAPTGTGGAAAGTLIVQGNPGGTDTSTLSGTGIVPAQFDVDDPESRDFGSVVVNTMSAQQIVVVRNIGGVTSAVPSITISGDFSQTNTCTAALAPNATCDVTVRFTPSALGARTGSLTISGAGAPEVVALSGTGITDAQIVANPAALTFALTNVGDTAATQTFTVTNQGAASTSDLVVSDNSPNFSTTDNCGVLANQQTCTVTVTFAPTATGTLQGIVTVAGTPGGTATVAVTGSARPRLEITLPNVNPFSFGSVGITTTTACQRVTVQNNTASQVTITETLSNVGPSAAAFELVSCDPGAAATASCNNSIVLAGDVCSMGVQYSPDNAGADTGTVTFGINGATTGPDATTQTFTGTGTTNALTIQPCGGGNCGAAATPAHDYGNVAQNTSVTQVFTVTNQTAAATSGPIQTQISAGGTVFNVIANNCAGTVLAVNATCTVTVQFRPTGAGVFNGTLQARDSGGGTNTALRNLTGTGVGAATIAYCTAATGACTAANTTAFNPTPVLGAVGSPVAEFVGQFEDRTIIVRNTGAIASGPISITRTNNDFAILTGSAGDCVSGTTALTPYSNPAQTTCPVGATCSCNVRLRYTPTNPPASVNGPTAAANDGTVVITATPGGSATNTLDASKQGTIEVNPVSGVAYGDVVVGTTADRDFIIENNSAQTVAITSITTSNPQFTVVNNLCGGGLSPFDNAAGGPDECQITVRFLPTAVATVSNVTLTVNGTNGVAQRTGLNGSGQTVANLVVAPAAFDFGSVLAGGLGVPASVTKTFTVQNAGFQDTGALGAPVLAGSSAYSITFNNCTGAVLDGSDPGGGTSSCDVDVTFAPGVGQTGALNATLTFAATPGGSEVATLTGNGLANGSVTVNPTALDFGSQALSTTSSFQTITIQNTSGSPVTLSNTLPTGFARAPAPNAGTCGTTLAGGTNCTFGIVFSPTGAAGPRTGQFLAVAGVYAAVQGVAISNANIAGFTDFAFGEVSLVVGDSEFFLITNNNAGETGTLSLTFSGGQADQFGSLSTCPGSNLAPGESCILGVGAFPTTTGPKSATGTLTSTAGLSIARTFTYTAVNAANIVVTPTTAADGARAEGAIDGAPSVFTVSNEAGAATSDNLLIVKTGGDTNEFVLVSTGATPCDVSGVTFTNLPNGGSCTFGVLFNPRNDGSATPPLAPPTRNVSISVSVPTDAPEVVTVSGTVTPLLSGPPATQTLTANQNLTLTYTNNASVATRPVVVDENSLGQEISVISSTCTGAPIAAGGTCNVVIRYVPNGSGLPPTGSITVTATADLLAPPFAAPDSPVTTLTTTFN